MCQVLGCTALLRISRKRFFNPTTKIQMSFQSVAKKAIEGADIIHTYDQVEVNKKVSDNLNVIILELPLQDIRIDANAVIEVDEDGVTCVTDLDTQTGHYITLLKLTPLALTDF